MSTNTEVSVDKALDHFENLQNNSSGTTIYDTFNTTKDKTFTGQEQTVKVAADLILKKSQSFQREDRVRKNGRKKGPTKKTQPIVLTKSKTTNLPLPIGIVQPITRPSNSPQLSIYTDLQALKKDIAVKEEMAKNYRVKREKSRSRTRNPPTPKPNDLLEKTYCDLEKAQNQTSTEIPLLSPKPLRNLGKFYPWNIQKSKSTDAVELARKIKPVDLVQRSNSIKSSISVRTPRDSPTKQLLAEQQNKSRNLLDISYCQCPISVCQNCKKVVEYPQLEKISLHKRKRYQAQEMKKKSSQLTIDLSLPDIFTSCGKGGKVVRNLEHTESIAHNTGSMAVNFGTKFYV